LNPGHIAGLIGLITTVAKRVLAQGIDDRDKKNQAKKHREVEKQGKKRIIRGYKGDKQKRISLGGFER